MKRIFCLFAALCLLLTGCGWMDGNYVSVTSHEDHSQKNQAGDVSASNYPELLAALQDLISAGKEKGIIYIGEYDQSIVESSTARAVQYTLTNTPLGAYAVEDIQYEFGSNGGQPAIALEITYLHSRMEILQIQKTPDMDSAKTLIQNALVECDASLVLLVETYEYADIAQLVEDYADSNPQSVMEIPQVSVGVYPESGRSRILELQFSYQNSRDSLRQMRTQVEAIFDAAALYVSSDDTDYVKFSQLYGFLMERFDYKPETSLTPAYSLLRHGVGDSAAFAHVYTAMCRQAGLTCMTVTGTCDGEPRSWNIVLDGENYFHVDLLRCSALGGFREFTDDAMDGYVWDYSAYPACLEIPVPDPDTPAETPPEDTTEPSTEATEPTEPSTEEPTGESTDVTEENTEN